MSDPGRGRSLELYFVDGTPDGLVTAEMFNWTGHVLMVPRVRLEAALRRPEAGYTGVYLLMGEDEGRARLYIGETERLSGRLKQHAAEKDWWDRAVLVTARADALNKAHARYLEARLCEIARSLGRDLENGNTPGGAGLSEAQGANMEGFLDEIRVVLPALGVDAFRDRRVNVSKPQPADKASSGPVFRLERPKAGLVARARVSDNAFVVLKGSHAATSWEGPSNPSLARDHADLCNAGILLPDLGTPLLVFQQDYTFSSPSRAADLIVGRTSGRVLDWKLETTGQTYKEWEAARLEAATEVAA
ncbi:GIY-YIG nuclease family protein [Mangrovicoccus ximenensis]|uniref:GIY-YIG nuclease family protein n=1 Tax=Mangrovicoccus ximenensis TaxID=1911570 RepID=UPI000D3A7E59|nr:GIY-YIG nuclease family protein [Mangrovicoccus ximenensis]